PRYDPGGAQRPEDPECLPPQAHCRWFWCAGLRGQPVGRALLRSEEDDGAHGWADRYAGWPFCDEEAEEPPDGQGEEGPEQEPTFPARHQPPRHAGDTRNA